MVVAYDLADKVDKAIQPSVESIGALGGFGLEQPLARTQGDVYERDTYATRDAKRIPIPDPD